MSQDSQINKLERIEDLLKYILLLDLRRSGYSRDAIAKILKIRGVKVAEMLKGFKV